MFNKILVAIDHEPGSKQVFDKALSLAKTDQGILLLLHVLSIEEEDEPLMYPYLVKRQKPCIPVDSLTMRRKWLELKEQGIKLLRSYTKRAIAAGIQAEFSQITGHPGSTICEFAHSCHADMVVIGRRGHSGLEEMFLGSVSNYVVHHAPCSILIVQTSILEELTSADTVETTVYR